MSGVIGATHPRLVSGLSVAGATMRRRWGTAPTVSLWAAAPNH